MRESIDGDHVLYHRTARAQTSFTSAEALGLCAAISASMVYVGFGVSNAPEE